jgi:hypothetical protein
MYEFACDSCGSPAVRYPETLDEHAVVVCARCAAGVCSYGEFRRRIEQALRSGPREAVATGC